jgi:Uma2 family endonuclease
MPETPISVEEYLRTSHRPDCEYVDGEVRERNVGELSHGKLQKALLASLACPRKGVRDFVLPSQKIQVSATRFRVPDVCVTIGEPDEQIFTAAPSICIEVVSPEDRMHMMVEKTHDYLDMGVPYVWILNPATKRVWEITKALGCRENKTGILRTEDPAIELPLAEVFE